MAGHGGWAGKLLRVDLSTGRVSREDTIERYKDYLGGTGIGYKVMWDEVPAETQPFDPENKLIFGVGVLAGTGAPCNGRTAVTTLFPTCWPRPLVATGHMGGHFAARLKYAGYDAIIVEGKADRPVWISIQDDDVKIKDARHTWGQGIRRTTLEITQELGSEAVVAAIGQAGENLLPMAVVMNSRSHSAGGVGGVMGSKNLKAIGVCGSGSVHIAGHGAAWEELVKHHLSILGANNQCVVPQKPQPWAEYYHPRSRWVAARGLEWGAADPPVDVGECHPHDLRRIAYRTNIAGYFLGENAWSQTVRGNGCTGCPIRCHTVLRVHSASTKYGIPEIGQNTCVGLLFGRFFFENFADGLQGQTALEACMVGMHLADDLGIWCNYAQLQRDFKKLYGEGYIRKEIDRREFNSLPWQKYEKGDPSFLFDLLPRIAHKRGELGTALGLGTGYLLQRWGIEESEWSRDPNTKYWKMGHPRHHAHDDDGQCGLIINTQYNRDSQCHSHSNFVRSGLPIEVQKRLAAEIWGSPDAVDPTGDYTPMNVYKAKRARWALIRKELHDSLSLCNWMGPWVASPLKERGYRGDESIESKLYSLVTGDQKSREELEHLGERIFTLHRALTIRGMGTQDMRNQHDLVPEWAFQDPNRRPPFTPGTIRMDRGDAERAMDMFYEEMRWDIDTGSPTAAAYRELALVHIADELTKLNLLR